MARRKLPSSEKAKKILEDNEVKGKPLSKKQKGFFGLLASGKSGKGGRKPKKTERRRK